MQQLASLLDRAISCKGSSRLFELQGGHFLQWGRRCRFNGLVIDGDVLVLDYKRFTSFRVKVANLPTLRAEIRCYRPLTELFDRDYRSTYFTLNQDNPYAIWNMLLAMRSNARPRELTQFPPLYYPKDASKQRADIDNMRERSRAGDLFFTFDRQSGLARLIRAWDRGMWSHCGMVGHEGKLYEMATSGAVESDFSRLYSPSLDVGLYRVREEFSQYDPKAAIDYWKKCVALGTGYGWYGAIRKALQKKFGIPFRRGPDDVTPADLVYGNQYTLICFA